jgi:hypothetical protein
MSIRSARRARRASFSAGRGRPEAVMAGQVIVGFDGSEVARATLACAARRIRRGDHLTVAHRIAVPEALLESPYFDQALERSREHRRRVLDESKGALSPDTPATTRLVEGPPARALVELARELDADEIAVGSRGFGAYRTAALGSTSQALLHETDRPVLIVARRAVDRELRLAATGARGDEPPTTVVGYDGSANSRGALEDALRRAEVSQGHVLAVCAFYAPADWLGSPYYQRSLDEHQQRARELTRRLDDLARRRNRHRRGATGRRIDTDRPGTATRQRSWVGARGLGRFRAALERLARPGARGRPPADHRAEREPLRSIRPSAYSPRISRGSRIRSFPRGARLGYGRGSQLPFPTEGATIAVAKVVEITAASTDSFDDAIRQGITKASATDRKIQGAWVKEQKVEVSEDGNITEYRVDLKVTFVLDRTIPVNA